MTVIYAAIAERFSSPVDGSSITGGSSSGGSGSGSGSGGLSGSIQQPPPDDDVDGGAASTPLLASTLSTADGGGGSSGSSKHHQPFDSSDGFSALFFLQSVAIGILFFLMPLFADSETGISSPHQFLGEEVASFAFLLLGAAGFIVDTLRRMDARRASMV